MKTLVIGRKVSSQPRGDATVLVWDDLAIPAGEKARIDEAAIAWTKRWGHVPLRDGRSFHDIALWKGVSLWWFAEIFLHYSTEAARYARTIDTLAFLLDTHHPDEVEAEGLPDEETLLLARLCRARGVLFHGRVPRVPFHRRAGVAAASIRSRWNTAKMVLTAVKTALTRLPRPAQEGPGPPRVLFLSHAAFWRERVDPGSGESIAYEHYLGDLIPGVAEDGLVPQVLAVGPRLAFRRRRLGSRLTDWARLTPEAGPYVHIQRFLRRRVVAEVWRGTGECRRLWRSLRRSPAIEDAFTHRGVRFADLAAPDLARTLLLQLPWAIRAYEEAAYAIAHLRPAVLCLYNETGGLGRATIAAARAAGVPSVGVQHGIIYPRYYSYTFTADEVDAPRPDRTAVFGTAARRLLLAQGHYDPASLVLTGSPKLDALLAMARRWDRAAIRTRLGIPEDGHLVVVASRFRGIRPTHQSIGSAFPALVDAIEALPGVHVLVKPHPAEPARAYEGVVATKGASHCRVLGPQAGLPELMWAADLLVTVESLSAVEALVLDRPLVILNMPTNLEEMVHRGVALGVAEGDDPRPALEAALRDPATRDRLAAARREYLPEVAFGMDGCATRRIVSLLRKTACGE